MTVVEGDLEETDVTPDWILKEYQATDPLDTDTLPEVARRVLANEINEDTERLKMEWLPDGRVKLRATQHVGIVTLPGGLTVEVRPKVPDTNLIEMLQYAQGVRPETITEETAITEGQTFIQALATLYEAELSDVLQWGLIKEYREQAGSEEHIRGRLNVQRQLQRHGPQPTQFECTYDELTQDIVLNQAILYATAVLLRLVDDGRVSAALQRHREVLQRTVELRTVRPVELESVELSRLSRHYEDLFRLTKLIVNGVYAEDLRTGDRTSFSLFVNMNDIFERVVERAVAETVASQDRTVERQAKSQNLVWGGNRQITIKPDILVRRGDDVLFVGDAKWKLDTPDDPEPSNSDIYQLQSYQLAHDAPGILFYPAQHQRVASEFESRLEYPLVLVEVPTTSQNGQSYSTTVKQSITHNLPTSLV